MLPSDMPCGSNQIIAVSLLGLGRLGDHVNKHHIGQVPLEQPSHPHVEHVISALSYYVMDWPAGRKPVDRWWASS